MAKQPQPNIKVSLEYILIFVNATCDSATAAVQHSTKNIYLANSLGGGSK